MAHDPKCDLYPDIWQPLPPDPKSAEYERVKAANERNGRLYRAVCYLLMNDFSGSPQIPEDPADFPGNPPGSPGALDPAEVARVAALQGLLLADDWEPSMGKTQAGADDLTVQLGGQAVVLDRRFVNAVVAAVQQYTAHAKLFQSCLAFLRQQGPPAGGGHHTKPGSPGHAAV